MKVLFYPLLALVLSSGLVAQEALLSTDISHISKQIVSALKTRYIDKVELTDELSLKHLEQYLNVLDPNRYVFLASDVLELKQKYGSQFSKDLQTGERAAVDAVFKRYRQRFQEMTESARLLLNSELDLNSKEKFEWARKNSPWPDSAEDRTRILKLRLRILLMRKVAEGWDEETAKEKMLRWMRQRQRILEALPLEEQFSLYANSLLSLLDPHSTYLPPDESADFWAEMGFDERVGVGIRTTLDEELGDFVVSELMPGGSAVLSGKIKVGDRIVGIGQDDGSFSLISDMSPFAALRMFSGKKGTKLSLQLETGSGDREKKVVSLVRSALPEDDSRARAAFIPGAVPLGIIWVPQFYTGHQGDIHRGCLADHVTRYIEELSKWKVDVLILDLRNNSGGNMEEIIEMAGLFLRGPVYQEQSTLKKRQLVKKVFGTPAFQKPMIVLLNKESASATEVLAAALQDHGRAIVVGGKRSFGKGSRQYVYKIPAPRLSLDPRSPMRNEWALGDSSKNYGSLKLTVARYYRVTGKVTQGVGVQPDIVLPSRDDLTEGEEGLQNALKSDPVDATPFTSEPIDPSLIEALAKRSEERVKENIELRYSLKDLEEGAKAETQTQWTIDLDAEIKRVEHRKQRTKARDTERASRKSENSPVVHFLPDGSQLEDGRGIHYNPLESPSESALPLDSDDYESRATLEEAIRIATDYVRLRAKESSAATPTQKANP